MREACATVAAYLAESWLPMSVVVGLGLFVVLRMARRS